MTYSMPFLAAEALTVLLTITSGQGRLVKHSDDPDGGALSSVVEQQANVIQQLQAEVQVLKTKDDSHENKIATLSKAVAFTVHFDHDDDQNGISLTTNQILPFDSAVTNIGQGYDTHTGMFTAPVAGTYAFFLTEMAPNNRGAIYLDIVKEDVILDETWAPGSEDHDDQGGTSLVTTHMAAGQRLWVRIRLGNAVRGGLNTIFTGYLINAE